MTITTIESDIIAIIVIGVLPPGKFLELIVVNSIKTKGTGRLKGPVATCEIIWFLVSIE